MTAAKRSGGEAEARIVASPAPSPESRAGPGATLTAIREGRPLVQVITNYVAMDLSANLLLAIGASPVMVRSAEEGASIAGQADALSVNIGTATEADIEVMVEAARAAVDGGHPWVLDPVGLTATAFRTESARRLSRLQPTVIRGNAGEILALGAGELSGGRGVESRIESAEALDAAQSLAKQTGSVVAVTGAVDYVTDGRRLVAVANGDPLMTRVTGLGCAQTALLAAALAVRQDALEACTHALAILGVAGEQAAAEAKGPGSFRVNLLDRLFGLEPDACDEQATIQ